MSNGAADEPEEVGEPDEIIDPDEVWKKLELSVQAAAQTASSTQVSPVVAAAANDDPKAERRLLWIRRGLDVLGWLFWTYVLLKVFVIDIDRVVLDHTVAGAAGILNLRFFFYLGILVAIVLSRSLKVYAGAAYVLFFPFVIFFWKIPKFFIKHRSWTLLLGFINAVYGLFGDFRYNLLTKSLALVATVIILTSGHNWLLVPSALYIFGLILWSFVRVTARAFKGSLFVRVQRDKIAKWVSSERLRRWSSMPTELRSSAIERYSQEQVSAIAMRLSLGLSINRGLYLWAYQLERYRKTSSAPILLAGLSYVWLFLGTAFGLSLINEALLKIDPGQFTFTDRPSFIAVCLYALSSLALADGGGFVATGNTADLIRIFAGIAGVVFLASFFLTLGLTFRRERDESVMRESIEDLRRQAQEQEDRIRQDWAVGVDEALRRLNEIAAVFARFIEWFSRAIPDEFFRDHRPAR